LEIIVLGSAHGRPLRGRFNTSLALVTGDDLYLLDCGEPCVARLIQEGFDPQRVRAAFVSHMHADHSSGLFMLLQEMDLGGRTTPFTLAVPEEAVAPLTAFLPAMYSGPQSLRFPLTLLPIRPNAPVYSDDHLALTAYRNSHLSAGPSGEPDNLPHSFSFEITVEGQRIIWTGDLPRDFAELGDLLAQPTDLLLSELTHLDPDALFAFLEQFEIGSVLFHHVWERHFEDFDDFGPMLARAHKFINSPVTIARDGTRLSL
jgi:phosphoribosyl 1,2-cyclic phosphodiesterase